MTAPAPAAYPSPGTRAFWRQSPAGRRAAFAALRRTAPVTFHEASLARLELRLMLGEILARFPGLHATAEPSVLLSPFVHGITALPCATY